MSFKEHVDWLVSLLLLAAVVGFGATSVDFRGPPFEDAAMLMRYADHVARGYGVVWNIGEHPVDGATDFLFMLAVAALIKLGVAIGRSVRILGYVAHALTVLLVYWVNRGAWKASVAVAATSALYLAVGTGLWYVAAYFGTPVFALLAAITWALALALMQKERPGFGQAVLFSIAGLLTGLVRPEGAILAAAMLVAVVIVRGWRRSVRIVLVFSAIMLALGGTYFLWRWNYFGYPLPNPFYKKGGGLLHWDSFWESIGNLIRFGGPFMLAFVLGFRARGIARKTLAYLLPVVVFAASFVLVSNETNFGGRFQYALWPLVLMSYYPLVQGLPGEVGMSRPRVVTPLASLVWILAILALVFWVLRYGMLQSCSLTSAQHSCGIAYEADGRYDVANLLAQYQNKDYVLATSEAGLLPLYSNWKAVDAWGLNDEWIAHNGEISALYLDRYKPNLIVFHAYFSPLVPPRLNEKNLSQDWFRMTITLKDYAESHGYVLAAAFGDSPYESHYYYVRSDFPDSERIAHEIGSMRNYYWFATGKKSINYAQFHP